MCISLESGQDYEDNGINVTSEARFLKDHIHFACFFGILTLRMQLPECEDIQIATLRGTAEVLADSYHLHTNHVSK